MEIDREYLEATVQNIRRQQSEAEQMVERTRGALLLVEALLARLDEKPKSEEGV
jgi:hypothetical protein